MQHCFAADAGHGKIGNGRVPALRAVAHGALYLGKALPQPRAERGARRRHGRGVQHLGGPAQRGNKGRVLCARAQAALLMAAAPHGRKVCAAAHIQSAHALGRVHLVAGHGIAVYLRFAQAQRQLAPGLHAVHMHKGAAVFPLHLRGQSRRVQHAAHLIVHVHGRHQRRFGAHCVHQRLHGHAARSVRLHQRHAPALLFQRGHGVLHGGVLVPGGDNMIRPGPAGLCRAEHGHVVAVGAAACEHHLARARAQAFGHGLARCFYHLFAARARRIQRRGVCKMLAQHTARNIRHLIRHGGGGRIVQIMHGFAPSSQRHI